MKQKFRRRKQVIDPRLQWKLTSVFVCLSCVAVLFHAMVVNRMLVKIAESLPNDGENLLVQLPSVLGWGLMIAAALVIPLTISLGLLATFRIAGPLYRFRVYLGQVARGEEDGPCRIRQSDELHDVCDAINAAVESLKARAGEPAKDDEAQGQDEEQEAEESSYRLAS